MARGREDDDLFLDDLGDDLLSDDQAPAPSEPTNREDPFDDVNDVPGQLAVDVYQTKTDVVVVAPVPGVNKNDVKLIIAEEFIANIESASTDGIIEGAGITAGIHH